MSGLKRYGLGIGEYYQQNCGGWCPSLEDIIDHGMCRCALIHGEASLNLLAIAR